LKTLGLREVLNELKATKPWGLGLGGLKALGLKTSKLWDFEV
jgi:hypothetical protein